MSEQRLASPCYDHLGGLLGERLARRLVALGWVTPEPCVGITPLGWSGLSQLGMDLAPLTASRRKVVCLCEERRRGQTSAHIGAHLGFLIRRHFLAAGWLKPAEDGFELTTAGEDALRQLGVDLEA